ncbi:MAG: efflux RND transporter periplasmic adaptor subunit [Terriglobales bacterium]
MTPQGFNLDITIAGFASRLLEWRETADRARITAQTIVDRFPGATVTVYLLSDDEEGRFWSARATAGDGAEPDRVIPAEAGTLGSLFRDRQLIVFEGRALVREDYAHLSVRRTLKYLACVPLLHKETLIGSIEILSFDALLDRASLAGLEPLAEIAAQALVSSREYEKERDDSLTSITRLTQFYDIEKAFSSTLEMDELLPIIGSKIRESLDCQGVNLWLVQGDGSLSLMYQAGVDPTTTQGMVQKEGEGIAGDVSENGEAVLIAEPEDERLVRRNQGRQEGEIESLMVAPLIDKGSLVGVVEAVNRSDGKRFDEDDLFVLTSLNETATLALHNASLLIAERKVEILETLVKVSGEITSTLNLERVARAIVDTPGAVIPYERAAIALEQRGKLQLKAVSGMAQINPGDPVVEALKGILQWAAVSRNEIYIRQHGEKIDEEREETRLKFQNYFAETGMRGFYALPLADDEGAVGMLAFESADPDFLTQAHIEMIKVLAGQATVALRNATMYKEVPFISLLEPILHKKQKFLALEKRRRALLLALTAGMVLFLAVFPLPMRVDGNATVAPAHSAQVQPEVEGVVRQVYVHEGQHIQQGQVLADLEDWEYRTALAGARAKLETANSEMNRALAGNDGAEAGIQRVQAAYWASEVERCQERLDKTHFRAPFDGWVTTPHVEDFTGRHLAPGDTFAQIVDSSQAIVEVAVDERDVALLHAGAEAAVKLDSFPLRTLKGRIAVVSPKSEVEGEQRVFYARVSLPNPDGGIRPGMQGRGKVSVGWHPVGYVLFRRPGMWIYSKLWSWLGW